MNISPRIVEHMAMRTDQDGTSIIIEWSRMINGVKYEFTAFQWNKFHTIEVWRQGVIVHQYSGN